MGTAVLLIIVCAITDSRNGPPPPGLVPLVLWVAILGIGLSFGMQTGYAINPARDLGPRLLTSMVGYGRAGRSLSFMVFCSILIVMSMQFSLSESAFMSPISYEQTLILILCSQYWLWAPIIAPILGALGMSLALRSQPISLN